MGQRVSRIAGGYEEANDANPLGKDPRFKMGVGRSLLEEDLDLARAATFSGRENVATSQDLYRRAQVLVDKFIGCYSRVAIVIVLDLDHAEDETHGPQEFSFHNHHHYGDCGLGFSLKASGENSSPRCFVPAEAQGITIIAKSL